MRPSWIAHRAARTRRRREGPEGARATPLQDVAILLAEDMDDSREVTRFMLESLGARVTEAHDYDLVGKVVERPNPKDRVHKPRESFPMPVVTSQR